MNKLLQRQIRRAIKSGEKPSPEMEKLLAMVSDSYDHYERDRLLIERAMEVSSEELRENYENLQDQKALKRSNEKLQEFVAIASHDLKAPLRTVGAFTQLLGKKVASSLDGAGKEYVKFILDGVSRMNTLIEDLICFSQIDTQNEEASYVDTNVILEKVKRNLHAQISESNGALNIQSEFPHILCLEFQVLQIYQNLIGNAFKFRGERDPEVSVNWEERKDDFVFSVKDNGIGIVESQQAKVFEIFQRLNNTTDFEGSGLGLSICRKAVENLDGKIWLQSEANKGTTFFFSLPKSRVVVPTMA